MELRGKVAVITGGGRGVGRSIALALAPEGARLALVARTESELKAVCEEVKALGAEAVPIPTDISDPGQVEDMAKETLKTFGTVDVVINNAAKGAVPGLLVRDTTVDDWDEVMNVNARGTFLVTNAFLPTLLAKKGGHVINVATVVAKKGVATAVAYCASKAAVLAFGQGLLDEVGPLGIRVTNVLPGPVNTSMRWDHNPDYPRDWVVEPEDVAQAIVSVLKMEDYVLLDEIAVRRLGSPE